MKNVRKSQLKKCIFMEFDEFSDIIKELFGSNTNVEYSLMDGIIIDNEDRTIQLDEINSALEKYFDVKHVTSIHADDSDIIGIWICYKEE